MPNIANVFKAEITRLARKEAREESASSKKALAAQRNEIAILKRRLQALESLVKQLSKMPKSSPPAPVRDTTRNAADAAPASDLRFRAAGMAANRKRLGLSAADFGLLVGATGQSVYAWEGGKSKPKKDSLVAIAALRGIGKRELAAKLGALKSA